MIQQLSNKFQKGTATFMFGICLNAMIIPLNTLASYRNNDTPYNAPSTNYGNSKVKNFSHNNLPSKVEKPAQRK
jgi:hypothetical protein